MKKEKMKSKEMRKWVLLASIVMDLFLTMLLFAVSIKTAYFQQQRSVLIPIVMATICFILCFTLFYLMGNLMFVLPCKAKERDEANFERLKTYLQGETKEIQYLYDEEEVATLLKIIVGSYEFHYFAKIVDNNTIEISVRDEQGKETCRANILNLRYFRRYFRFEEENKK